MPLNVLGDAALAEQEAAARLVYIDDDEIMLEIAAAFLKDQGLALTGIARPREAVAAIRAIRPDMVLLDQMMPEQDGFETLRQLRREDDLAAIPVIFVTADADAPERARMLRAGASGVIAKPFTPVSLVRDIRHFLEQAR